MDFIGASGIWTLVFIVVVISAILVVLAKVVK